jgi:hypothetical protein
MKAAVGYRLNLCILLVEALHHEHAKYRDDDVPEIDLRFLVHDIFLAASTDRRLKKGFLPDDSE